jgi:hypothetical protein
MSKKLVGKTFQKSSKASTPRTSEQPIPSVSQQQERLLEVIRAARQRLKPPSPDK